MEKVYVLIDFDNFFGVEQTIITSETIEYSLTQIVNFCESEFTNFDFIEIRLYGGWYKEKVLSKQASTIIQLLSDINVFPKIVKKRLIQGSIEITSSLFEIPKFVWNHTYKETEGISRIRINHDIVDEICNLNREICPKFILYKFTKKKDQGCKVEDCMNLQKNVFKGIVQKMVDTMIACDIISISEDESTVGIVVISEDQDHFPSLAAASQRKSKKVQSIILGIQNTHLKGFYESTLSQFKIKIVEL